MIYVRRIVGDSMLPSLKNGQVVLAVKWPSYKLGQVIIAKQNGKEVIKRIARLVNGGYFLLGDNPAKSSDSRKYGPVHNKDILGKVIIKR